MWEKEKEGPGFSASTCTNESSHYLMCPSPSSGPPSLHAGDVWSLMGSTDSAGHTSLGGGGLEFGVVANRIPAVSCHFYLVPTEVPLKTDADSWFTRGGLIGSYARGWCLGHMVEEALFE